MLGVDVGAIAALPIFNSVYNYVSLFIYAVYPKKKKKKVPSRMESKIFTLDFVSLGLSG